jgi:hypothetical protein
MAWAGDPLFTMSTDQPLLLSQEYKLAYSFLGSHVHRETILVSLQATITTFMKLQVSIKSNAVESSYYSFKSTHSLTCCASLDLYLTCH